MKITLTLTCLFISAALLAQEANDTILLSRHGTPVLPQSHDWAIGADALPYLNYLGNIFHDSSDNHLNLGNHTLYFRYFIADKMALRVLVRINHDILFTRKYVNDDAAHFTDPLSMAQTEDTKKSILNDYGIDLGIQKFRGYGRLRGFYGVHAGYSFSRSVQSYKYGNPVTSFNTMPSSAFGYNSQDARILMNDEGISQYLNAGFIAGAEYYFLPKVCIGGELTLSAAYSWKSQGNSRYEKWNGTSAGVYNIAVTPPGPAGFSVFTLRPANFSPGLYLMFHF